MAVPCNRLVAVGITFIALVACAEDEASTTSIQAAVVTTALDVTTTVPETFCGVAKIYATEVVDALENEANEPAENSPLNTRAFWERYKELQTKLRDLAPSEIRADAQIAYESAMAAYDYMEEFTFSMKLASQDPTFVNDERFTGERYLRAGVVFQGYIDKNCDIELTK